MFLKQETPSPFSLSLSLPLSLLPTLSPPASSLRKAANRRKRHTMGEDDVEVEKELLKLDYDELDEETGFKKVEWTIWQALQEWRQKPEDDREPAGDPADLDARLEWAKWYASEGPLKPPGDDAKALTAFENRCVAVVKIGLYAGRRDDFNQRNGKAKTIYKNGDVYEGQYFEGKKNGQGKYVSRSLGKSDVDRIIEQMVLALPEEDRVYVPVNECYTVAAHKHDEFVATVCATIAVGADIVKTALEFGYYPFYQGDYQSGVRNGIGMMKARDGSVYKGEWAAGSRSGQGILFYTNGDKYSGNWEDGSKSGYGTYAYAYWSKGMRDGKPWYQLSAGGDFRGEWGSEEYTEDEDGEKVKKTARGMITAGEWHMPGGLHYEGTFNRHSQPHTKDPPPLVLQADGTPPPNPKTYMHFPKMGLAQAGIMSKVCLPRPPPPPRTPPSSLPLASLTGTVGPSVFAHCCRAAG